MSVIITGMDMPKSCYNCEFKTNYKNNDYGSVCECSLDDEHRTINLLAHIIPHYCPLKSVEWLIERIENLTPWDEGLVEMYEVIDAIKEYCEVEE